MTRGWRAVFDAWRAWRGDHAEPGARGTAALLHFVTLGDGSVTFSDVRVAGGGRPAAGGAWRACAAWRARHGGSVTFCDIL